MRDTGDMCTVEQDNALASADALQARSAALEIEDRMVALEQKLKVQSMSISAYHHIAMQAAHDARDESNANLDRKSAKIMSQVERVKSDTLAANAAGRSAPTEALLLGESALSRIALLEDRFDDMNGQINLCIRGQREIANALAFLLEQQVFNRTVTAGGSSREADPNGHRGAQARTAGLAGRSVA